MDDQKVMLFGIALILASGLYVVAASAAGTVASPSETPITWGLLLGLACNVYGLVGGVSVLVTAE